MAGDWIAIEHGTPRKPEVFQIAAELGTTRNEVVGMLVQFWCWVDDNLSPENGDTCPLVYGTNVLIDEVVGRDGFGTALANAGWVQFEGQMMRVVNYDHHLSESAKKRKKEARKKRKQRAGKKVHQDEGTNVPKKEGQTSPKQGDKIGTTEQNRTEHIIKNTPQRAGEESDELPGNEEPRRPLGAGYNDLINMTEEEAVAQADSMLVPAEFARAEFNAVMGREGKTWNGVRITSWRHYVKGEWEWSQRKEKNASKSNVGANGGFKNPRHEARKRIEAIDWSKVESF